MVKKVSRPGSAGCKGTWDEVQWRMVKKLSRAQKQAANGFSMDCRRESRLGFISHRLDDGLSCAGVRLCTWRACTAADVPLQGSSAAKQTTGSGYKAHVGATERNATSHSLALLGGDQPRPSLSGAKSMTAWKRQRPAGQDATKSLSPVRKQAGRRGRLRAASGWAEC